MQVTIPVRESNPHERVRLWMSHRSGKWFSRSEIRSALGLTATEWMQASKYLAKDVNVRRVGERKATRYSYQKAA
jgi:hypothetical protein